ncbi:MAG: hypothetical protein J5I53_03095 [Bradyrhizobiaceae bacterium]|nr:hypothetical protein [Bradyrhizobiaceae bacterium]
MVASVFGAVTDVLVSAWVMLDLADFLQQELVSEAIEQEALADLLALLALLALLMQQLDDAFVVHSSLLSDTVETVEVVLAEALADDFLCPSHFMLAVLTAAPKQTANSAAMIIRVFIVDS